MVFIGLRRDCCTLRGNSSTSVQILPAILHKVKKVEVYIRSKTWITAGFAQRTAGLNGSNVGFTDQKKMWADNPGKYLAYWKDIDWGLNSQSKWHMRYKYSRASCGQDFLWQADVGKAGSRTGQNRQACARLCGWVSLSHRALQFGLLNLSGADELAPARKNSP